MESFEGWAIVEIMGHRRLAGYCSEAEMYGAKFLRIDCYGNPDSQNPTETQFYGANSVYCLTPTTEDTARRVGTIKRPEPVALWELPRAERPALTSGAGHDDNPNDEPW